MRSIEIMSDPDELARRAVEITVEAAVAAIAEHGRFALALTGGSTPEKTYTLLASPENAGRIDWSRTFLFLTDERDVPVDAPSSNFGMARRTLIDRIEIPSQNVFPMVVTPGDPLMSAQSYDYVLRNFFGPVDPRFDLIHLGMGDDGHTASLFPGKPSLGVLDRWVVSSPPGVLPPPVDRVTMTLPVLNAAARVTFFVTGDKKAQTVHEVLDLGSPVDKHPSAGVNPSNGSVIWVLDGAAASKLEWKSG